MIILTIVGHTSLTYGVDFFPKVLGLFLILVTFLVIFSKLMKIKLTNSRKFSNTLLILFALSIISFTIIEKLNPPLSTLEIIQQDLIQISISLEKFKSDNSDYPSTEEGLQVFLINPDPAKYPSWKESNPINLIDPWGEPYKYLYPGVQGEYDIYSFGADKIESDDDIGNWFSK